MGKNSHQIRGEYGPYSCFMSINTKNIGIFLENANGELYIAKRLIMKHNIGGDLWEEVGESGKKWEFFPTFT